MQKLKSFRYFYFTRSSKLLFTVISSITLSVFLTGCAGWFRSPVVPFTGGTFNETRFPVDLEFNSGEIREKQGEAKACSIMGLFAWGTASPVEAAYDGGISTIDHIDARFLNILGIYSEYEIIVYGE